MVEDSCLYQEVFEQPQVLDRLLKMEEPSVRGLAAAIRQRRLTNVTIAARGTSDNAGRYAQYLLGAVNGLLVGLATPSLFTVYGRPPTFGNSLVLGISQSGKSPDVVGVLEEAHRQGALTAAITNEPGSDVAQAAEHVIDLHAGREHSVAATKTYTSELAAIALLGATLAEDQGMLDALAQLPQCVKATLALDSEIAQVVDRYQSIHGCVVIGRGYNYATAFELALKLTELTYVAAVPYSSADFMHGPIALVERGYPVFVVAPSGALLPQMVDLIKTLKARHADVLAISDEPEPLGLSSTPVRLPVSVPEWLSPVTAMVAGQLLVLHLAEARGLDLDRPRGLRKITETL